MNRFPSSQESIVWWRRVRAMTRKELLQLWRDPILLFFIAYAFTADIYLAGSGVSLELKNATTVYQDNDRSFASRELVNRFQPPHFRTRRPGDTSSGGPAVARRRPGRW